MVTCEDETELRVGVTSDIGSLARKGTPDGMNAVEVPYTIVFGQVAVRGGMVEARKTRIAFHVPDREREYVHMLCGLRSGLTKRGKDQN